MPINLEGAIKYCQTKIWDVAEYGPPPSKAELDKFCRNHMSGPKSRKAGRKSRKHRKSRRNRRNARK